MASILIIDDEEIHARAIARFLDRRGHACEVAVSGAAARRRLAAERPDVVLLDVRLPDDDGVRILADTLERDAALPIIMMTAYGSVETAVAAMKVGARDYVQKPIDLDELELIVTRALGEARTRAALEHLQRTPEALGGRAVLLGQSAAMQPVHAFLARMQALSGLAAGDYPTVLLLGETGTGKGLVARLLHEASPLAHQPLLTLDCTALPKDLVEAELFGFERGAFTDAKAAKPGLLEVAAGGTLFLDEIAELSHDAQGKLLRLIEEKRVRRVGGITDTSVDVRIIAATNRDPEREVEAGRFRRDLLYRLNVLTLTLPPLRERGDDIRLLAEHFITAAARKYGRSPKTLSASGLAALLADPWFGTWRELSHGSKRAVLLVDGETIDARHLGRDQRAAEPARSGMSLEEVERQLLQQALAESGGNVTRAARRLGVSREVMRYRMRKHGLGGTGRADGE